jgi:hypothetical protein
MQMAVLGLGSGQKGVLLADRRQAGGRAPRTRDDRKPMKKAASRAACLGGAPGTGALLRVQVPP